MGRRIDERHVRNLYKHSHSYAVTLPIEMVRELKWRENQKIVFKKSGQRIIIEDWKP
jgi:antitoxin component of MazEF toxin-antitoxin module